MTARPRGLAVGVCAACGLLIVSVTREARADEARRLVLDPPQLLFGTADGGAATRGEPDAMSQAQIAWLAFGADALLELGASSVETGVLWFAVGALNSNGNANGGPALVSLVVVGLMLAVHPALDAFLVDAVARLSHSYQPSLAATLVGSYLGCLLGVGGFVLALVTLESIPVLELVVASLLNALLPAATTVLAEVLFQQKVPDDSPTRTALPGNAVARGEPPDESSQAAWRTGLADPLARWAF